MTNRSVAKIIRDPIHDYISIYEDELPLLDCALVQRLRNVRQNGMAYFTYPALNVSRFEHSLGVMHLADQMLSSSLAKSASSVKDQFLSLCAEEFGWAKNETEANLSRVIRAAGLLHDLGQLPFSHTLEELAHESSENILSSKQMEKWKEYIETTDGTLHEFLTIFFIESNQELSDALGEYKQAVLDLLRSRPCDGTIFGTLHELLAFDIDADRADYLLRDGRASGAEFGNFDLSRLVEGMRLIRTTTFNHEKKESFVIRPTIRALSAVESLIIERYKSYRWLYHHQRVVITNRILEEIVWRLLKARWDRTAPLNRVNLSFPLGKQEDAVKKKEDDAVFCDDIDLIAALRQAHQLLIKQDSSDTSRISGPGDIWIELYETVAMLEEVLHRKKRGVALWKDIEAYKEFDEKIANQVEGIFTSHQRERYLRTEGRVLPNESLRKTTLETDFTLNWVVNQLLGRSFAKRKELEMQVNKQLRGKKINGSLLLSVTFFKPWEYRQEHEYEVVGRDDRLHHVSDVSPIVKQLKEVNRKSIRLYAYLVLDTSIEQLGLAKQKELLGENAEKARKVLAENLIKWVKRELGKETRM